MFYLARRGDISIFSYVNDIILFSDEALTVILSIFCWFVNFRYLDRRKRLIIAMDAAFGMEYLHSKNIVHFDLKCDNLLVNLKDPLRPICKVGL